MVKSLDVLSRNYFLFHHLVQPGSRLLNDPQALTPLLPLDDKQAPPSPQNDKKSAGPACDVNGLILYRMRLQQGESQRPFDTFALFIKQLKICLNAEAGHSRQLTEFMCLVNKLTRCNLKHEVRMVSLSAARMAQLDQILISEFAALNDYLVLKAKTIAYFNENLQLYFNTAQYLADFKCASEDKMMRLQKTREPAFRAFPLASKETEKACQAPTLTSALFKKQRTI